MDPQNTNELRKLRKSIKKLNKEKKRRKKKRQIIIAFLCRIMAGLLLVSFTVAIILYMNPIASDETTLEATGTVISVERRRYRIYITLDDGETFTCSNLLMAKHDVTIQELEELLLGEPVTIRYFSHPSMSIASLKAPERMVFDYEIQNAKSRVDVPLLSILLSLYILGGICAYSIPKLLRDLRAFT